MAEIISSYSKYIFLFAGLALGFFVLWPRRERLGVEKRWEMLLWCLFFTVGSLVCTMFFAAFESILGGGSVSFGSVSTFGVYLFLPPLLFAAAKLTGKDSRDVFDVFAFYALPSLFLMRCNCLVAGCCQGLNIGGTHYHWPTREVELAYYVVMFAALLRRERKETVRGQEFPLLMLCYGCFRFVEEWFRASSAATRPIHLAHAWAIITAVVGFSLYAELGRRKKRKKDYVSLKRGVAQ